MAEQLIVLAEVEYSNLLLTPVAYRTPVWKYLLWNPEYKRNLDFTAEEDGYPDKPVLFGNVIIDQEEYTKAGSIAECLTKEKYYFREDCDLYIHFPEHNPAWLFTSQKYGTLLGFSNKESIILEPEPGRRFLYKHGLLTVPPVTESADPLVYSRMQFDSASYNFVNILEDFDAVSGIFGNEFNVRAGLKGQPYSEYRKVAQYYIANLSVTLEQAAIAVKDKRERLSFKAPDTYYDRDYFYKKVTDGEVEDIFPYKFIAEKNTGKLIQDAYGHCFGVKGTCIDETDLYLDKENYSEEEALKRKTRSFKFARRITRLDKLEVKMSQNDLAETDTGREGWTVIYPRQPHQAPSIAVDFSRMGEGILTIPLASANAGGKLENQANEVRADGIFNPQRTPRDIIKDLLEHYADIPFDGEHYKTSEFNQELQKLDRFEAGICLDSQKDVFEWIEMLQNGSVLGFQFMPQFNLFTARLDNPNRPESFNIKQTEILHLQEVTVDWNADLYASYTDIKYAKTYTPDKDEEAYSHIIDASIREKMLDMHRLEKALELETLLSDKASAELKGKLLLEDFSEMRPVISGIQLFGMQWFDLRVYDTGYIDFSIKGDETALFPVHIVQLVQYLDNENKTQHIHRHAEEEEILSLIPPDNRKTRHGRTFAGRLRCQILRRETDLNTGIVTVDVRQRSPSVLQTV